MITYAVSPAPHASTEATHATNPQLKAPSTENAIALVADGLDEFLEAAVVGWSWPGDAFVRVGVESPG